MTLPGTTVRDALDSATIPLQAAGCGSPRLDAELLLAAAMGIDRAALYSHPEAELQGPAVRVFQEHVQRRRRREPVAYILGHKAFRHLDLHVDRRVLIPRPETEMLVEAALSLPEGARVVDVGTGCGAVALALKHERPDLQIAAADVSEEAVEVARDNARRLDLDVSFHVADLLAGVPGPWDAVLGNLPYVLDSDHVRLAPEITGHEPAVALYGGPDGLGLVRRLMDQLADARFVALEIGAGQHEPVVELLRAVGFAEAEPIPDLARIERVVVGRR